MIRYVLLMLLIASPSSYASENWYVKDICNDRKNLIFCKHVGKDIERWMAPMRRWAHLGVIYGVVYIEKGENRGTNQYREAVDSGFYYIVDCMVKDKSNCITIHSQDNEIRVTNYD